MFHQMRLRMQGLEGLVGNGNASQEKTLTAFKAFMQCRLDEAYDRFRVADVDYEFLASWAFNVAESFFRFMPDRIAYDAMIEFHHHAPADPKCTDNTAYCKLSASMNWLSAYIRDPARLSEMRVKPRDQLASGAETPRS